MEHNCYTEGVQDAKSIESPVGNLEKLVTKLERGAQTSVGVAMTAVEAWGRSDPPLREDEKCKITKLDTENRAENKQQSCK